MKDADTARQYFEMGLRLLRDDHRHSALSLLSSSIDLNSRFGEAHGYRGLAHFLLGMYQEAMDDYNTCLSLDSSLETIYYFRGVLHLHLKHYQQASNDFTVALEWDNYFAEAYYHRGICKKLLGEPKGAIYDIRSAAQLGMRLAQKILNDKGVVW
jgi:tetratricopeptide (TPR) repeat protein